jgi:photosystem II stability/assembly factor-like uncharacterized protein
VNLQLTHRLCALGLVAVWVTPLGAQKWQVQYFYDKGNSSFTIGDLQFASASRGVAVGVIADGKRKEPTAVVTSDGGAHWQTVPLKETPLSLFFLNESMGWMVTTKGLWRTTEGGQTWTKLPKVPEIYRVYFIDEKRGFAVGPKKIALETLDGGTTWKPLGAGGAAPKEDVRYSAYTWIAFAPPRFGLITGWNIPPRRFNPEFPDWVDPEGTLQQREQPHVSYTLTTEDGGARWTLLAGSAFGTVSRVRLGADGTGLGLVQYGESFRYPSEVYSLAWPVGRNTNVYRDAKFDISDIWRASDGTAYLAGVQVRGQMRTLIPGKVQVLTSTDLKTWTSIPVDYRAEANSTILAASDDDHLWLATNTGMILKLVR